MRRLMVVCFMLGNAFLFASCSNPYLFYTGQPVVGSEITSQRIVVQFQTGSDSSNTVVSRLNEDIYRWGRVRLVRPIQQDAYVLRVRLYQGDTDAFLEYISALNYVRFADVDRTLRV